MIVEFARCQVYMERNESSKILDGSAQQVQATSNTLRDAVTDDGGAGTESETRRKVCMRLDIHLSADTHASSQMFCANRGLHDCLANSRRKRGQLISLVLLSDQKIIWYVFKVFFNLLPSLYVESQALYHN